MSITFNRIRWKNLLSTGNDWTEIDLSTSRTTLIIGENGSGKSTILDAITYALYNKPFRKINKPQLRNSINGKHCVAEIEFETGRDSYLVRRGMFPNLFEIEKNGELINQDASSRDYQEILEKYILKLNYKSFCQVVILGSASFVPFMQLPTGQRREIIEDLLDIQIFTTMNMLLKDKMAANQTALYEVDYGIDLTNEKTKMHEENLRSILANSAEMAEELKTRLGRTQRDLDNERAVIAEKEMAEEAYQAETLPLYNSELERQAEMAPVRAKLEAKAERLRHEVSFFGSNHSCPTCRQVIDEVFRDQTIDEKKRALAEVEGGLSQIDSRLTTVRESLERHRELATRSADVKVELRMRREKAKGYESGVRDLQDQIERIERKSESYTADDGRGRELEDELERLTTEKSRLHEVKEMHRVTASILKDTGIKSRIIKQYIPVINKLINKYLAAMDFFVQFELDENFSESIKSRFRDEFSYASFSEGEKAKIDLALLFAWRAVAKIRNSAATNLIILDEVFDGSLDANSSDELLKILLEISNNSNIFTISHKTDALLDKFDRVIRFEKKQNFSSIAE